MTPDLDLGHLIQQSIEDDNNLIPNNKDRMDLEKLEGKPSPGKLHIKKRTKVRLRSQTRKKKSNTKMFYIWLVGTNVYK